MDVNWGFVFLMAASLLAAYNIGRRTARKPAPTPAEKPRLFGLTDARALRDTLTGNPGTVKQVLAYLGFRLTVTSDAAHAVALANQNITTNKSSVEGARTQITRLKEAIEAFEAQNANFQSEIAGTESLAALFAEPSGTVISE